MIIMLAGKRKEIQSHSAKHISWQHENFVAPFLTLSISSHGFPLKEACTTLMEMWMMCFLHLLWAPCAKPVPCLYATGNRNQVFSPPGNVCKRENEQKGIKPSLFSLFYHLVGRRPLWMNCLKNTFPQISIIFVYVHTVRRHLCLAFSTLCISSIPRAFAYPL